MDTAYTQAVNVRIQQTTDVATVRKLHAHCFPATDFEGKGNTYWLAITADGDIAGFASARESRKESASAYFSRCGIMEWYRGHRIQRRLIRARVRWARREGYTRAVTYCTVSNVPSQRNLIREGFLPYRPKPPWAGADVVYFERVL